MTKKLTFISALLLTCTSYSQTVGYLVAHEEVIDFCKHVILDGVAAKAGPEIADSISYFKAGATAKKPYKSCCGIENWGTFDPKKYTSEFVDASEWVSLSADPHPYGESSAFRLNQNGSAKFNVANHVTASTPDGAGGFTYIVYSEFYAKPSSKGWMIRFNSKTPTAAECLKGIALVGYSSHKK